MFIQANGQLQFGAHTVGGRNQHGVFIIEGLQVKQPAKSAKVGVGAFAARGAGEGFNQVNKAVAFVDIHTCLGIGGFAVFLCHRFVPD